MDNDKRESKTIQKILTKSKKEAERLSRTDLLSIEATRRLKES